MGAGGGRGRRGDQSIALVGNAAEIEPAWAAAGERFDVVTDQTSAHDAARRLRPGGDRARRRARAARAACPTSTSAARAARWRTTSGRCSRSSGPGAVVFDYGNNLRAAGAGGRRRGRLRLPGLRARLHPAAVLRGPRPVPLGRAVRRPGRHPPHGPRGARAVPRRRRPAPLDRDGPGARPVPGPAGADLLAGLRRAGARPGSRSTSWSGPARSRRPIVIGRDHLDAGSVASPNRETEAMADGSDAVADWPLLNALVNTAAGATWVSIHHGGGVGIGY